MLNVLTVQRGIPAERQLLAGPTDGSCMFSFEWAPAERLELGLRPRRSEMDRVGYPILSYRLYFCHILLPSLASWATTILRHSIWLCCFFFCRQCVPFSFIIRVEG